MTFNINMAVFFFNANIFVEPKLLWFLILYLQVNLLTRFTESQGSDFFF